MWACGRRGRVPGNRGRVPQAYRWQYVHSGAQQVLFGKVLSRLITDAQGQRIQAALATLR